jgi:Sulfotransferase family
MTDRMPDFIVAGVARAGTTSLANWLGQHPELHLSPIKETNFFARPDLGTAGPGDYWLNTPPEFEPDGTMRSAHFARIETWEEYVRCFIPAKPGARWRGEASVSYSFYPAAPARIAKANPQCKIVFVLRDPVSRAVSNYALFQKLGIETLSMEEALNAEDQRIGAGYQFCWAYAGLSRYREIIRRYLEYFPAAQIHVAKFEDLIQSCDPESWCALLRFLDVDESFEPFRHHLNDTKEEQAAHPLDDNVRTRLRDLLAEETHFFESLFPTHESNTPPSGLQALRFGR